uniref:Uncharacterized protein n=1 Tax=Triticum monococcum TaxID=4568 RepID=Q6RUK9_TRIMO|nr:putative protein [Triticum monococcum]
MGKSQLLSASRYARAVTVETQRRRRPCPPLPDVTRPDYFRAEIERTRASLSEKQRAFPEYDASNHEAWARGVLRTPAGRAVGLHEAPVVRGSKNSDGRRLWWGAPGRTLHAVLKHLEGGNDPRLTYPAAPRQGRARGNALGRRTRSADIVINEGVRVSSSAPPRLVKPKTEPGLTAMKRESGLADVKTEPGLDDNAAMNDDDAPPPANHVRQGDPGQGSSNVKKEKDDGDIAAFNDFFSL